MKANKQDETLRQRSAPLEMTPAEFREVGHQIIDQIADWLATLADHPVAPGETPQEIRSLLGGDQLPDSGESPRHLFEEATELLFDHSVFNGHPRFWGYITSSAAPIGALADLLAAAVNPNVGGWDLSPMATEIEAQTIQWIAEFIGYPPTSGGLLVSGGNMANFVGFFAARTAKVPWNIREEGLAGGDQRLVAYGSKSTHTWIEKAADLSGLGTNAIRWIETDAAQQMDLHALEQQISSDRADGYLPFLVVGAAGTVGTGAVDPLPELAALCREQDLWLHVDGAYGAPAAALPEASPQLKALAEADSVALDPHKWLYSPLEAGCILVRKPQTLVDAFSFHPVYYGFDGSEEDPPLNYYELGPQNSRGFRALKVWLGLRQVGRAGYVKMIREDIALAQALYQQVDAHPELEAVTHNLSITTFRYVPQTLPTQDPASETYLNALNKELMKRLQTGGEVFVSNMVVNDKYVLRACIVNFRTTLADIEALPEIVARLGQELDAKMRPVH